MPRVVRSPTGSGSQQTSDSDAVPATIESAPSFVSQRHKRQRESSEEKFLTLKEEIKAMFIESEKKQESMFESKLNKLISEIADVKMQNMEIKKSNEDMEKNFAILTKQYEEVLKKVESLENERKQHLLKIVTLETTIEDMQRSSKSSSIEIRNVPLTSETETKSDLCNIVQNTCKVLNVAIPHTAIRDVFRINTKSGKGTIIADLTSTILKTEIIQRVKSYNKEHPDQRLNSNVIGIKGQSTPIYISEALTAKGRRLFFLARDIAKTKEYKFCWTKNGKIYLRKDEQAARIEVKDETQLTALRNQL